MFLKSTRIVIHETSALRLSPLKKIFQSPQISRCLTSSTRVHKPLQTTKFSGSNPALSFPCLDKLERKNEELSKGNLSSSSSSSTTAVKSTTSSSLESGPEPSYGYVKTGFHLYKSKNLYF